MPFQNPDLFITSNDHFFVETSAAGAAAAAVGPFALIVNTFLHCGQRILSMVLPRKTASGTRIAVWHLWQTTRMEPACVAGVDGAERRGTTGATGAECTAGADATAAARCAATPVFAERTVPTPKPGNCCVDTGASLRRTG